MPRIPEQVGTQWEDRSNDKLSSCSFQVFCTKMDEIKDEFNDSPRKQTKVETIVEGFRNVFNVDAAKGLVGQKFVISRSGKPLYGTTLPTEVLRTMPLPDEFEQELGGNVGGVGTPPPSSKFGAFNKAASGGAGAGTASDNESKRIAFGAKQMFMQLGAALEVIYIHEDGDLFIVEVVDTQAKPDTCVAMVEGVFDGGEHPEGLDYFNISIGVEKEIN